jgi:hypothetical protein
MKVHDAVSPGSPIVSSPAVSSGKLFLGTRNKGVLCLADPGRRTRYEGEAVEGPGGDAGRTGCAMTRTPVLPDDRGEIVRA